MNRNLCAALITLGTLTFATAASAQSVDGALRLHLETDFLGVVTFTPEDGDSSTSTSIGPGSNGLGFGVGYGITDSLVVGGNATVQYTEGDGSNNGELTLSLLPYLELVLGADTVRPFVGGNLIFALSSRDNSSQTELGLGGLGGVHIFLTDTFSLDLSGRLFFTAGTATVETAAGDADFSFKRFGLLLFAGVSGWSI